MVIDPEFNVREKKFTKRLLYVNVHPINGDVTAITFLKNADLKFVEGLFFFAKRYGYTTFSYEGSGYVITRNRNLTYTVRELREDEDIVSAGAGMQVG
ncbi:MAG: hypothetical protein HYZ09_03490 [Candidatus Kerfeldbacteria bacterium]|nr:hypothetical protein [Candidatus Kerfeldbacteria bacterium]